METFLSSSSPKRKFLINVVVLRGGEGHYATYRSLRCLIEKQELPWELRITDMDEIAEEVGKQHKTIDIFKLFGTSAREFYDWMQKNNWTWLHSLIIRLYKLLIGLNHDLGVRVMEEYWREQQPDMVLVAAPYYQKILWESLQKAKPGTPIVTVLTDFADCPPAFWIEPEMGGYFICGTEKAVKQARSQGVEEDKIIKTSGLIIHPKFYEPISCDRGIERQKLGLDSDCLTGLVMFGGNGSKIMLDIAKRLECFQDKLQLIFLCGRNEELASALRQSQGLQKRFVINFTENIPYYMHLADFFIGKPGPGSLSEAAAMKLPVITECNFSTMIQERHCCEWITDTEIGIVTSDFRNIERAVAKLIQPENYSRYRANLNAYNNQAVFEVVDILKSILEQSYKHSAKVSIG